MTTGAWKCGTTSRGKVAAVDYYDDGAFIISICFGGNDPVGSIIYALTDSFIEGVNFATNESIFRVWDPNEPTCRSLC